jgi:hypothetical protein
MRRLENEFGKKSNWNGVFQNLSEIEKRLRALEKFRDKYEPVLQEVIKFLDISRPKVDPKKYCSDEIDRKIIDYLIENKGAGTTEIAKALGLDPEKGRHIIGKRLAKMQRLSEEDGWDILEFHPERKEGKFRAWWINIEQIDVESFRR